MRGYPDNWTLVVKEYYIFLVITEDDKLTHILTVAYTVQREAVKHIIGRLEPMGNLTHLKIKTSPFLSTRHYIMLKNK
jgi:hypothetical protein